MGIFLGRFLFIFLILNHLDNLNMDKEKEKLRKRIICLNAVWISFILTYILGSFILGMWNIALWEVNARIMFLIAWLCSIPITIIILDN